MVTRPIPGRDKKFFSSTKHPNDSGVYLASCSVDTEWPFPQV